MACFGGGGGGSAKAAQNTTADPCIAQRPFLEVSLTLGNAHSRETVMLLTKTGEYLFGADESSKR